MFALYISFTSQDLSSFSRVEAVGIKTMFNSAKGFSRRLPRELAIDLFEIPDDVRSSFIEAIITKLLVELFSSLEHSYKFFNSSYSGLFSFGIIYLPDHSKLIGFI